MNSRKKEMVSSDVEFNYDNYGAFKSSDSVKDVSFRYRLARAVGLKNRYIRFLDGIDRAKQVIEVGCGDGAFMCEMMRAGFSNVVGVELSTTYVPVVPNEMIIRGDARDVIDECQSASLGAIVALDVFEHIAISDLEMLFRLAADRLALDGAMIFRVPNMASPIALFNYFGDLSHVTPLNEISIKQLAFGTGLRVAGIYPEPLAYPKNLATALGHIAWPVYRTVTAAALRAFGIRPQILTPAIICILKRDKPLTYGPES